MGGTNLLLVYLVIGLKARFPLNRWNFCLFCFGYGAKWLNNADIECRTLNIEMIKD
jgi:hypothetical protein